MQVLSRFNGNQSGVLGGWVADFFLLSFGTAMLISGHQKITIEDQHITIVQFLAVTCLVPWYMGYLLHHFDSYSRFVRLFFQWAFAIIIVALIAFLVVNLIPLFNEDKDPTGIELFLVSFGMFFMVLGPLMILGGVSDAQGLDEAHDLSKPIVWPIVTFTMIILTLAVFYMILIMGFFDPTWSGNGSFWMVIVAFLGGPLLSIVTILPFALLGKVIEKYDHYRILLRVIAFIIPAMTFYSLLWWNDIVLFDMSSTWNDGKPSPQQVIFSMVLSGIIPFRIIMLFKPPFKWLSLAVGLVCIAVYVAGVMHEYGAI